MGKNGSRARSNRNWQFIKVILAVAALLGLAKPAGAVLAPATGVNAGIGRIEHGVFNYAGASAPALFDDFFNPVTADGGAMFTPGFGYPIVAGAPVFEVDTGSLGLIANVPVFLTTAPQAPSGFGGANTRMVGVGGGGRAGVAATNFTLSDNNIDGAGRVSTNTFAASVVYNNVGGAFNARFGHFLAANVFVGPAGYAAAGVKSIFEVGDYNALTGAFFADTFWEPLPILVAFDGLGAKADMIQAGLFNLAANANALTFSAISATPLIPVPAGKSVRMRGTVSLIADPASFDFIDLPFDLQDDVLTFDLGVGGAANGGILVPEPATMILLGLGLLCGIPAARRRCRTTDD